MSVDELRKRFQSADPAERYRAVMGLAAQPDRLAAIIDLQHGLDDTDSAVRAGAARRLAEFALPSSRIGDASFWLAITNRWQVLLDDHDPDVRFESIRGLLHLDPHHTTAVAELWKLFHIDEVHPLMLAAMLKVLGDIGPRDVPPGWQWSALLRHPHAEVREQAARTAGLWRVQESSSDIVFLLDDDEPFVREEAARALGLIGQCDASVLAALRTASEEEDEVVAETARQSLEVLQTKGV